MKASWGSGGRAPRILWPLYYIEMSSQLHAPTALPPGKEHPVPTGQEAGWASVMKRLEPPIIQPVAQSYTTRLYRLL
jgi:hypothetical protein